MERKAVMEDHIMSPLSRRTLLVTSAAAGVGLAALAETNFAEAITGGGSDAIRPFRIAFPDAEVADLRRRVSATKFPERETVPEVRNRAYDGQNFTQGVPLATMQKLARYWGTEYDWRKCEARLNTFPQFMTEIDGLDFHFVHVRSKHENALPMVLVHGWPGSFIELLKLVDPLTNPTAHGGTPADAFHVVIPSMAGYGFSGKPSTAGWGPERMARAFVVLMKRLGYKRFVAQGGDWGALIVDLMGIDTAPELIGIHSNMPRVVPAEIDKAAFAQAPAPAGLSAEERQSYDRIKFFYAKGLSYAQEMAVRPQTLYGIQDSPIGLAAWMLDHDSRSLEMIARAFDGVPEGLTRDDVLDNITMTWLTGTGVSSARLYAENKFAFFSPSASVKIPAAVSVFPDEIFTVSRAWAERGYPKLIHFNRLPKGGHFAAWEQPALLTQELRTAFRSLRGNA
jgi:pimeloyl-ACP methyl ester carboxylesterase